MAIVMMSPDDMDTLLKKVEKELAPGKTFALVGFIDMDGLEAGLVVSTLGGGLKAEAVFKHSWDGTNSGGAKLLASW